MEKLPLLLIFPFIVWVLLIGWLIMASRSGRSIRLSVKGLGVSISLDTKAAEVELRTRKDDAPTAADVSNH